MLLIQIEKQHIKTKDLKISTKGYLQKSMAKNLNLDLIKRLKQSLDAPNEKKLNLASNEITSIDDETFDTFVQLETLDLSYNKLTIIKSNWFKRLENLKELNLDSNGITNIDDDAFDRLIKLETLYLDSNKLTTIISNWFKCLENLKELDLDT